MNQDCERYETYTLKVDSVFAPANNSFIGYINIPLRNVVKAEVLSASISSNISTGSSNVAYLYAMELDSKFNDRMDVQTTITSFSSNTIARPQTSNIGPNLTGTFSNLNQIRTSLVAIPMEPVNVRTLFTVSNYFPTEIEYIEPIRQIQQLTISLYNETGGLLTVSGPTFLVLRLTCSKPNRCLY
jgi:hypothetical protein